MAGDLLPVETGDDVKVLKSLIQRHLKFTGSEVARRLLLNWEYHRPMFKKVFPMEYRKVWNSVEPKKCEPHKKV